MTDFKLRERCHVCTNEQNDRFVGIRADAKGAAVFFPMGFQLSPVSSNENALRRDVLQLILVLSAFAEQKEKLLVMGRNRNPQEAYFPINAYMAIISDYMNRSYYTETERQYTAGNTGKINWLRTIKKHQPLIQRNGSLIYTKFEVYRLKPNENNMITRIHEYCVYEAFQKLGWLFSSEIPRQPQLELKDNKNMFIGIVRDKLKHTFIDNDKLLFQSMIDMLSYLDENSSENLFYFGTYNFEYVWERLIDRVFGVKNKHDYFPRAHWRYLADGSEYINYPLEPDSIMIPAGMNKIFVLDAKYYRYGITGNAAHLPPSSSINKQITYGEFACVNSKSKEENSVFNAFLMPYNNTKFDSETAPLGNPLGLTGEYTCAGEAYGEWRKGNLSYETVQGIVADTRHLMFNYTGNTARQIKMMADTIISAYEKHRMLG